MKLPTEHYDRLAALAALADCSVAHVARAFIGFMLTGDAKAQVQRRISTIGGAR